MRFLEKDEDTSNYFKLSVSKSKTFESCKAKYHFCYIQKLPRKEQDFHIFGTFNHEVLEKFHLYQLNGDKSPYKDLMKKCFKESFENFKDKITKEQFADSKTILSQYIELLEKTDKQKTTPEVLFVEKPFNILIDDKIVLNGFIDRVQMDTDGVLHVADYKTTKNPKYLKDDYFQLITYSLALMLEDESLKKIRASYILLKHNYKFLTKEFNRDDIFPVEEKFKQYYEEIQEERLWRAEPQFLCKYCDYLDHCSDGNDYLIKIGIKPKSFGKVAW